VLYGLSEVAEDGAEIWSNLAADYTPLTAYSFMLFNLLCAPCFAAIGAIKREMNNAKWTWAAIGYLCGYAYVIAFIVYQLGKLFAGGGFGVGTVFAIAAVISLVYLLLRKNRYGEYGEYLPERKVTANA
jgi:ferrous iron transport protein B